MAPRSKNISPNSSHKNLTKQDLDSFHANLTKTCGLSLDMESSLRQLKTKAQGLKVTGLWASAVEPLKQEVRKCLSLVESALASAKSQEMVSASLIAEGRIGEALTAINQGMMALGGLKDDLTKLRTRLDDMFKEKPAGRLAESLEAQGFDKDLQDWGIRVDEWLSRTVVPSWKNEQPVTS